MRDILFLTHRIPYPPDKGDKIRAWNVLRHLASRHRVHLGTFIDEPEDVQYVARLEEVCASVFWRPLSPRLARLRSLRCLLTGAPLTQGYFGDARFQAETDRVVALHKPSLFYIYSSAMAPYVAHHRDARVIVDMVDVDSEKWRQYGETSHGPGRLIYAREGRTLLALERQAAKAADAVVFVSRAEAALFTRLAPESASQIHYVSNGVDSDHFSPSANFPNPLGDRPAIVFTGAMNYRPNVEAMSWFVGQVMPRLRAHSRAPCLWIVGSNPCRAVLALAGPDVRVTGRVADVRPYLGHAAAVVAPLQIARGIQNKVLEAMAMGAVVVVTPQVREGLDRCSDEELLTAATPVAFADAVSRILDGDAGPIGARARVRVVRDYHWRASLTALDRLVDAEPNQPAAPDYAPASAALRVLA
jgi:sugar transferase (PEP-CTERM/EpsH1 system associated)